jgi:hypothetical protein
MPKGNKFFQESDFPLFFNRLHGFEKVIFNEVSDSNLNNQLVESKKQKLVKHI